MDKELVEQSAMDLVHAVQEIFAAEAAEDAANAPLLQRAMTLMEELRPDRQQPQARQLPGCQYLSRTLELATDSRAEPVADALRILEPALAWAQNPRYDAENKGADFMERYGWSALGLTGSTSMAFGVLLLGPDIEYPPTSYESEGVFLVIGGSPEWKSGDEPWKRVKAGDVICRAYGGSEGKRPGDEPMLALYAWMYR